MYVRTLICVAVIHTFENGTYDHTTEITYVYLINVNEMKRFTLIQLIQNH